MRRSLVGVWGVGGRPRAPSAQQLEAGHLAPGTVSRMVRVREQAGFKRHLELGSAARFVLSALQDQNLGAQREFSFFSTPAGRRAGKPVLSKVCPLKCGPAASSASLA